MSLGFFVTADKVHYLWEYEGGHETDNLEEASKLKDTSCVEAGSIVHLDRSGQDSDSILRSAFNKCLFSNDNLPSYYMKCWQNVYESLLNKREGVPFMCSRLLATYIERLSREPEADPSYSWDFYTMCVVLCLIDIPVTVILDVREPYICIMYDTDCTLYTEAKENLQTYGKLICGMDSGIKYTSYLGRRLVPAHQYFDKRSCRMTTSVPCFERSGFGSLIESDKALLSTGLSSIRNGSTWKDKEMSIVLDNKKHIEHFLCALEN